MVFFLNLIHLRPCRTDLLVTCLPLQSAMIGDTLGDFVSSLQIILLNYIRYSGLLNSFAYWCFWQLWSIIEEVELGVSDNGQKSTSRETLRISLVAWARSVLVVQ